MGLEKNADWDKIWFHQWFTGISGDDKISRRSGMRRKSTACFCVDWGESKQRMRLKSGRVGVATVLHRLKNDECGFLHFLRSDLGMAYSRTSILRGRWDELVSGSVQGIQFDGESGKWVRVWRGKVAGLQFQSRLGCGHKLTPAVAPLYTFLSPVIVYLTGGLVHCTTKTWTNCPHSIVSLGRVWDPGCCSIYREHFTKQEPTKWFWLIQMLQEIGRKGQTAFQTVDSGGWSVVCFIYFEVSLYLELFLLVLFWNDCEL